MVETFAIKGFCYVMLPLQSTNKQKKLDRETIVIKCFKLSGDFTLLYIQEADRVSRLFLCNPWVSNNGTSNSPIPPPQAEKAVESFKYMLMAEESGSMSSVRDKAYKPPDRIA